MTTEEVVVMKRKSYVTCLTFNLVECSAHFPLHSTRHKEGGVGDRRTLQNLLLWVWFIGGDLKAEQSAEAWRGEVIWQGEDRAGLEADLLLPRPVVFPLFWLDKFSLFLHGREAERRRLQREGLTHGARSPMVFSNNTISVEYNCKGLQT